ncbi:hypothetical protein DSM112329_03068 [Paraconexibacter sp. AEG42_29]|uniref:Calcium-binding protein n=1 Tax=Paraconexibacter sp. AEG42_29 TaxID=2997339 RepID=A0AAU7AX75_9ACTN
MFTSTRPAARIAALALAGLALSAPSALASGNVVDVYNDPSSGVRVIGSEKADQVVVMNGGNATHAIHFAKSDIPVKVHGSNCTPLNPVTKLVRCARFQGAIDVTVVGAGGDDNLFASSSFAPNVTFTGNDGDDTLTGGAGYDSLAGNAGEDEIKGAGGGDRIWGGADRDAIVGGAGIDNIEGNEGNDVIDLRDGAFDGVNCGSNPASIKDVVYADPEDGSASYLKTRSCEVVAYI